MTELIPASIDACRTAKREFEDAQKVARTEILDRIHKIMQDAEACGLLILDHSGEPFDDIIEIDIITDIVARERGIN